MSRTIDDRVVEMQFDNGQFERNVAESMSTIDKLKQSLNFGGVGDSIGSLGQKFSAFETICVGALMRIGSQAVETGEQLIKSLSIDNISAGWEKFGEKTRSVGTLVSQGYDMEMVNDQMERLNWFTDETSYNFTDMVGNIAKFTATGQDLENSVTAMEGIALWAALSGQNATKASQAMYQLSQAMSKGALKFDDWKSIQNASMDTVEFRNKAVEAAEALGAMRRNADGTFDILDRLTGEIAAGGLTLNELFSSDALTKQMWLDTDVMMSVFNKYSAAVGELYDYATENDITASEAIERLGNNVDEFGLKAFRAGQEARTWGDVVDSVKDAVGTGWMNTFENIFGNYEEAKTLWTDLANELYDVFAEGGNVRNKILKAWKEGGGRDDLVESFWNIFHAITAIIDAIKGAYQDIFKPIFSDEETGAARLWTLTARLKEFTSYLTLTEEVTDEYGETVTRLNERGQKLKDLFKGVFAVFALVKDVVVALIKPIGSLFKGMSGTGGSVLDVAGSFGDLLVKFRETVLESGVLEKVTGFLSRTFEAIGKVIANVTEGFKELISGNVAGGARKIFEGITQGLLSVLSAIFGFDVSKIREKISEAFDWVNEKANKIDWARIKDSFSKGLQSIKDAFARVSPYISAAFQWLKRVFETAYEAIARVLGKFKKVDTSGVTDLGTKTTSSFQPLMDFFKHLGTFFSGVWNVLKIVFSAIGSIVGPILEKIGVFLKNASLHDLVNGLKAGIQVFAGLEIYKGLKSIRTFWDNVDKFVKNFGKLTKQLGKAVKSWKREVDANTVLKIGITLAILAGAILLLTMVDTDKMIAAAGVVAVLVGELAASVYGISKVQNTKAIMQAALAMIEISAAVLIMAKAIAKLAKFDPNVVTGIAVALGVLIGAIAVIVYELGKSNANSGKMKAGATAVLLFSVAVSILASALKKVAVVPAETLWESMKALSILVLELLAVAIILSASNNSSSMMSGAANLIAMAAAIAILAITVRMLAKLAENWVALALGLGAVTLLIIELTVAMHYLGKANGASWSNVVALLAFTSGISKVAKAVCTMGQLGLGDLSKGIIAFSLIIGQVTAALMLVQNAKDGSKSLLLATVAVYALGLAIRMIGKQDIATLAKGIGALAIVFGLFIAVGYALTPVIATILGLGVALLTISSAVLILGVGVGILTLSMKKFSKNATAFAASISEVLISVIVALVEAIPKVIHALANSIAQSAADIVDMTVSVIRLVLTAIETVVPDVVSRLLDVLIEILHGVAERTPELVATVIDILIGIIDGIASRTSALIRSFVNLIKEIFAALEEAFGSFDVETILKATAAMIAFEGLLLLIGAIAATGALVLIPLPVLGSLLSTFIKKAKPFLDEIKNIDAGSVQSAKTLAETILILTAANVLDGIGSFLSSRSSLTKFGIELAAFAPKLKEYSDVMKNGNFDSKLVDASANSAKALAAITREMPRQGGIASVFFGENSLVDLAVGLKLFATPFIEYAEAITAANIEYSKLDTASASIKALITSYSEMPNQGGLISMFAGDNSLVDLAFGLKAFVKPFCEYASAITAADIDFVKLDIASSSIKTLIASYSEMTNQGGLAALIAGDNSLIDLALGLKAFVTPFSEYAKEITTADINFEKLDIASGSIKTLITSYSEMPNQGGIVSLFTGDNSLIDLAIGLKAFVVPFISYARSISNTPVSWSKLEESTKAITNLVQSYDTMPNQGGIAAFFAGDNTLELLGEGLKAFSTPFVSYARVISKAGIDWTKFEASTKAITDLVMAYDAMPNQGGIAAFFAGDNTLEKLAEGLQAFSEPFLRYAKTISNTAVGWLKLEESTKAITDLIHSYDSMPNEGGVVSWFTGDNTLEKFGNGLYAFSSKFISYARSISSAPVKWTVLETSTKAITDLVHSYDSMPNQGGVASWFAGDNTLEKLGEGLHAFSPNFVSYARTISNAPVKWTALETSTKAITDLIRAYDSMPNQGGVASWFAGDNTLEKLGEGLKSFGPDLVEYASVIAGADLSSISSSNAVIHSLIMLQSGLTDDTSYYYTSFGDSLRTLGQGFSDYCDYVAEVDTSRLTNVISETRRLVDLAKDLTGVDTSAMGGFATGLTALGNAGVDGFISAFDNSVEKVNRSITTFLQRYLTTMNMEQVKFRNGGASLIDALVKGIDSGINIVTTAVQRLVNKAVIEVRTKYENFRKAGEYLVEGFAKGITDKTYLAEAQSRAMAKASLTAAEKALDENSPSEEFYKLGDYGVIGFANAFRDGIDRSYRSGTELAEASIRGTSNAISHLADAINSDLDTQPTIRPVLDLTDVHSGIRQLDTMMSRDQAYNIGARMNGAFGENQNGVNGSGTTFSFTQINNSPKALSNIDIYRQTKNQFSIMKGLIGAR